jgi:hypothetical protein
MAAIGWLECSRLKLLLKRNPSIRKWNHLVCACSIKRAEAEGVAARVVALRDDCYPKGGEPIVGVSLTSSVVPVALKATSR